MYLLYTLYEFYKLLCSLYRLQYKPNSLKTHIMKAPLSKTAKRLLSDPVSSKKFFEANREAMKNGSAQLEVGGRIYKIRVAPTIKPSQQLLTE